MKTYTQLSLMVLSFALATPLFSQTTHDVSIQNFTFSPASLEINVGDIVRWTNNGGFHSVDANATTFPNNPETFGNSNGPAGWVYEYTFNIPGEYDYRCGVHTATMFGDITVIGDLPTIHDVTVSDFVFTPEFIQIEVGDIVRWTNVDGFHNVDGNQTDFPDNPEAFGNEPGFPGWVYEHTFSIEGTYDYQCVIHPFMLGQVEVVESMNALATINGLVDWDSDCGDRPLRIGIYESGSPDLVYEFNIILSSDGSYTVGDLLPGTYDIFVKPDGSLQVGHLAVELESGENTLMTNNLIAGDMNGDNGINISDISVLNLAFGSSIGDPNFNISADTNCDGNVNIIDISILNANFGISGDNPGVI